MSTKKRQPKKRPEPKFTSTDVNRALQFIHPMSDCQPDVRLLLSQDSLYSFGRSGSDGVVWIREMDPETFQDERPPVNEILVCGREALQALRYMIDLELRNMAPAKKGRRRR